MPFLEKYFFRGILRVCILCMLAAMCMYMALGTFSRYMSDDFCETIRVNEASALGAVIDRYTEGEWRAANRYSNLLFVGFSEWLGPNNVQITTPLMIFLWMAGLIWAISEIRRLAGISWRIEVDLFLGISLAFLTILQAPHLFQTLYWRSSMFTHFAPLVFGVFLLAFLIRQAGCVRIEPLPLWKHLIVFFAAFVIAGFSEPPVATMVTALTLAILAVWFCSHGPARERILKLLGWAFAGAFLGLLVMVFSPANLNMPDGSTPGLVELFRDTFLFAFVFINSTFKTLPLPAMISILIPALLVWLCGQMSFFELSPFRKRRIWLIIAVAPFVMYLLIAAGFSPSVYGQGFPVERMRFAARWIMTLCLMLEGGMFGLLLQSLSLKPFQYAAQIVVAGLFSIVAIVYPLRAALNIYHDVPEYRARAGLWDLRDAYMIRHAALGETDIIVPGFSGVYGVKELDDDPTHWVNVCAAQYYGVNSIRAVPVPDEYIREYFSE